MEWYWILLLALGGSLYLPVVVGLCVRAARYGWLVAESSFLDKNLMGDDHGD